ncbi:hypothetical protein Pcinc_034787 [Petrolisthes cinctipes]|uniref:CCHC-type domain-containing protein n=1 Tax=Petrolisthes cinctipes TaxID=88211 RepID=A0AAE1ENX2_PETCI|nr:hypothetical protein Pcinc_034787 [Petrolisthes cinctipes]
MWRRLKSKLKTEAPAEYSPPEDRSLWKPYRQDQQTRKPVVCFLCNRPGHVARNCRTNTKVSGGRGRGQQIISKPLGIGNIKGAQPDISEFAPVHQYVQPSPSVENTSVNPGGPADSSTVEQNVASTSVVPGNDDLQECQGETKAAIHQDCLSSYATVGAVQTRGQRRKSTTLRPLRVDRGDDGSVVEQPIRAEEQEADYSISRYLQKAAKGKVKVEKTNDVWHKITSSLTDLLRKGSPSKLRWESKHQEAFELLKRSISSSPILRTPDFTRPFVVQTDASDCAEGAALLQEFSDGMFPVAFASRKLQPRETSEATPTLQLALSQIGRLDCP